MKKGLDWEWQLMSRAMKSYVCRGWGMTKISLIVVKVVQNEAC